MKILFTMSLLSFLKIMSMTEVTFVNMKCTFNAVIIDKICMQISLYTTKPLTSCSVWMILQYLGHPISAWIIRYWLAQPAVSGTPCSALDICRNLCNPPAPGAFSVVCDILCCLGHQCWGHASSSVWGTSNVPTHLLFEKCARYSTNGPWITSYTHPSFL